MKIKADNYEIYKGDCLELMKNIPDKSIDMILCDLPYETTRNSWDKMIDLEKLWEQYERIIKDNGAIVLFAQTPFDKVLGASNLKPLRYVWIRDKKLGTGHLNAKKLPLKRHENILVFYKKLPTYNPQMTKGDPYDKGIVQEKSSNYGKQREVVAKNVTGERYPTSILEYTNANRQSRLHPTQKPISLLINLIRTYTNENEVVLDNCMGSGSTGVACILTDRKFIGIELDDKYFEISKSRLNEAVEKKEELLKVFDKSN